MSKPTAEELAAFRARMPADLQKDWDNIPENLREFGFMMEKQSLLTKTRVASVAAMLCVLAKKDLPTTSAKDLADAIFQMTWTCAVLATFESFLKEKAAQRLKNLMELTRPEKS